MTTVADARKAIYNHFVGNWTETDVVLQNEHFEPQPQIPWTEFALEHAGDTPLTVAGANRIRRSRKTGFVAIKVNTPYGQGLAELDRLVTIARYLFRNLTLQPGNIRFSKVLSRYQGVQSGNWEQTLIRAEFDYIASVVATPGQTWAGESLHAVITLNDAIFSLAGWYGLPLHANVLLNNATFSHQAPHVWIGDRLDAIVTLNDATFAQQSPQVWTGNYLDAIVTLRDAVFTQGGQAWIGSGINAVTVRRDATFDNQVAQIWTGSGLNAIVVLRDGIFTNGSPQAWTGDRLDAVVTRNDAAFANLAEWQDNSGSVWEDNSGNPWEY